jgi:hypothetical protein
MELRHERKYLAPELSVQQVLLLLHRHPAVLREMYPTRRVNSLYLDTPGLADYFDHVHGAARRSKTRIRWYGTGAIRSAVLERKCKLGSVGHKLVHALGAASETWLSQGAPLDELELADEPRTLVKPRRPVIVTSYDRYYYATPRGDLRVTVDFNLMFSKVGRSAHPRRAPAAFGLVIELKYGQDASELAGAVAAALPFRMARCSKYVLGVESS